MIENGKTGLLVPPKNVDVLADAIISLLKDDALRGYMERRIREDYFVGENAWKVIAEKYLEFYKNMK